MNISYPIQGLAIVGPIIFLVMAILTPIIGVFSGWKRAAYWGGGNFVVYFGGLASWKLAGDKLIALFQPLIKKALESIGKIDETQIATLAKSLVAPVFLLVLFLVMNLILFICYYAFAKRCMRIGKFSPEKRLIRLENKIKKAKINHKDPEVIAKLTAKKNKWEVRVQKVVNSVGHKVWFNRTIGGISFTVAMLPVVLTIPQVITMVTTSKETRAKNKFASKIYDFLYKANDKLSFMYYYTTDTCDDFDAGLGILTLMTTKITYKEFTGRYDESGNPIFKDSTEPKPVLEALGSAISTGMTQVIDKDKTASTSEMSKGVNILGTLWNSVVDQSTENISAVFQSKNVTGILEPIISSIAGDTKPEIPADQITTIFGTTFNQMVDDYINVVNGGTSQFGITTPLHAIPTTQTCVDNVTASIKSMINLTGSPTAADQELFDSSVKKIVNMLLYAA